MKASKDKILWSGSFEYTLTASSVASDEMKINYSDAITVYPYYKAGAAESGNTVSLNFEANPLTETEDPTDLFWSPFNGVYTDSSGTWSEEKATFNLAQGTADTYIACEPIYITGIALDRIRIKAKENGVSSAAGKLKLIIVKHNKNN